MAASIICRSVRRAGEKIYVRWSDKTEMEFESVAELRRTIRDVLEDDYAKEVLKALLLAKYLKAQPDGTTLGTAANKTMTLDLAVASNLVRLT